ncbi:unnamed protein product [Rhodiola kirilowii]
MWEFDEFTKLIAAIFVSNFLYDSSMQKISNFVGRFLVFDARAGGAFSGIRTLETSFRHAEGTMNETVIPTVTKALESRDWEDRLLSCIESEIEWVTNLKVQVLDGIASVELTKQTTIQSTRTVASGMVEKIQGSGFSSYRL